MSAVNLNHPDMTIGGALSALGPMLSDIKIEGYDGKGRQRVIFIYNDGNRYEEFLPKGRLFMEANGSDLSIHGIKLIMRTMDAKFNPAQRELERACMRRLLAAPLPDYEYKIFFKTLFPEIHTQGTKDNNHLKFIC